MTEEKVKGIVVKLTDYSEADKIASIFTLEKGVISVKFKGVRREKAKLKAVALPFVFADFSLYSSGENNTIISADIIDSFVGLSSNYNKTMCAYIVLDCVRSLIMRAKKEEDLFVLTLNALKNIETQNEYISVINYILKFLDFSGVGIEYATSKYVYLDTLTGNFTNQHQPGFVQIDGKVYSTLLAIKNEEQVEENEQRLKQILRLLHNVIYLKLNEDLKSFQFI